MCASDGSIHRDEKVGREVVREREEAIDDGYPSSLFFSFFHETFNTYDRTIERFMVRKRDK